jgi:hypothetical protein
MKKITQKAFLLYVVGIFILSTISEAAVSEKMHEASQFYQAREFNQALEIYEDLLKTPLNSWEFAVVKYDSGCVYLSEGENLKAITLLDSLSLQKDLPPLLVRNIKANLAFAYLNEGINISFNSLDSFSNKMFYLWEAQAALESAKQADCQLAKAEGAVNCDPSLDLTHIENAIKIEFSKLFEESKTYRIKFATLKEGLPLLFIGINQMERFTKLIEKVPPNTSLMKKYLEYAREKGGEWIPLWNEQQTRLENGFSHDSNLKQLNDLFLKAKKDYTEGLAEMLKSELKKGAEAFGESAAAMLELIHLAYGERPLEESLQKLLIFYQTVLFQSPLQVSLLDVLLKELKETEDLLPSSLKGKLDAARNDLSKAIELLEKGNRQARLYLLQAYHSVQLFHREIRPSTQNPPLRILEDVIEDQRYAISYTRLFIELHKKNEELPLAAENRFAQQQVLGNTENFSLAVLDWQKKEFKKKGDFKPSELCQSQPWDEVLPLFYRGYEAASQSLTLNERESLVYQGKALNEWQEALEKMKNPKHSNSSSCAGNRNETQPQDDKKKQKSGQSAQKDSFQNVASELMRMQEEDRLPRSQPEVPVQVERPW